ncbi:50S ribosomal protein L25/general stress protein Ctc [Ammoniphilus oxalaticus]|uniref:Large ribosomal subunit protein bL25 n=1 Tax=Ammoniphilus oxalaticus TaxID=66863 RepID=A0A419SG90_9BACL|nr:50S ribosomal protein L25/general stress protein Ctc [Ammoniphilus oxalaticus]RKD22799.1 50S ribosomal protein L25/general stress protein Ctc [Ammoniphilus oxalaticus]
MAALLEAQRRQSKSRSGLNELRKSGRVPGVLYGMNKDNEVIHLNESQLNQTLRSEGRNAILDLAIEAGPKEKVVIAEIQTHPIRNEILHLDLRRLDMTEEMVAAVSVILTGEAEGAKAGGVLQHLLWEVEVRCLPADLPDSITVDISNLQIGDTITVQDLEVPAGVEIQQEAEEGVVSVTAPRQESVDEEDASESAEAADASDADNKEE